MMLAANGQQSGKRKVIIKYIASIASITAVLVTVAATPATAGLLGTSVSGSLVFGGGGANFYDPGNGFVPAGFGNSNPHGPENVVIGSGTEFGFSDGANTDTADFNDTSLTITDVVTATNDAQSTYTFTNTAFLGETVTQTSNTFPQTVTETLVGDVLTVDVAETGSANAGTKAVTFSFAPTVTAAPEPASLPLLVMGLAGLGMVMRIRRV